MSKLIAVCGDPGSGKTMVSLKLAQGMYALGKNTKIVMVSPDLRVPTLGYLFPNAKDSEMFSLGKALDKTDIFKEDVFRQLVTDKNRKDLAILGYKLGENRYSYPEPTEDKILQLFSALGEIADYVVLDCTSEENDLISRIGMRDCDSAVVVHTPDLKSLVYSASCVNEYLPVEGKSITILNTLDYNLCLPFSEVGAVWKDIRVILPYSRALKHQVLTGSLMEPLPDRRYLNEMYEVAKAVMADDGTE